MLKKTFVLFFLIVTGLAFALSPAASAAAKKLHFGMPTPKPNVVHIPVYLALDRGFYKAQGLDVKISRFRGGTRAHQAITAKGTDLDLAWIPGPLTMSGIARGSGLKMFYSYAHKNEAILAVQADIKKPADLRGKKLGIEGKFGYSHLGMLSVIQPAGVTDKDVIYVRTTPPQRVSFIISGKVDAVLMHIEQVAFASKKTKGRVHTLARIWETQPDYLYAAVSAPGAKIKANRRTYVSATRALINATRFMYKNKAATINTAVKFLRGGKKARKGASKTYDIITRARIWTTNVGLPMKVLRYTNNLNAKLGRYKKGKPKIKDLVDFRIGRAAMKAFAKKSGKKARRKKKM